ncbi:MAG TPA: hypothetical protein VHE55_13975 [Fimbriimonadaceae bacterium]|nr:hypothetical protein [Fimbriimonadaceae bacterium]
MNKNYRASYKIAIGFALFALLAVYGYHYANLFLLGREHFPRLVPGNVNIVGLDTSAGYGILVENRVAKLVMGSGGSFGPGKMNEKDLESSDGDRHFIPIKDMLQGMQGNVPSLSYFVQRLNDISDDDLPPDAPVWKTEDIEKAIKGDDALRKKLVEDINVNLDGTPLDHLHKSALQNGILIDTPVPLTITHGATKRTVVARVKRSYHPIFISAVENDLNGKWANDQMIATQYAAEAQKLKDGQTQKENVPERLLSFASDAKRLGRVPQQILDSITCVINENQITGARYVPVDTPKGKVYSLLISLTDEGTKRMWQFSNDRVGDQLLLTVRGVAIAAPFIDHALSSNELEITRMEDESLVKDAVDTINEKRAQKN